MHSQVCWILGLCAEFGLLIEHLHEESGIYYGMLFAATAIHFVTRERPPGPHTSPTEPAPRIAPRGSGPRRTARR